MEEKALKEDEIKRKYDELQQENYRLCKDKEEMKDRLREVTEMLREWEYKYESKINELEARHSYER